jgi:DNA-binding NtrC family response regulator
MSSSAPPFDVATLTLPRDPTTSQSERRYLLLFEGDASRVVALPTTGEVLIGRSPDVDLPIADLAASRQHAKIVLENDEVLLVDLGSRNGTHVNGERVVGARALRRGDVVAIGATSIVVHRDVSAVDSRTVLDERQLRRRLAEEIARSARHPAVLAVLVFRINGAASQRASFESVASRELRGVDVLAWAGINELIVLSPEIEEEPVETARRLMTAFASVAGGESSQAGLAQYPMDGGDADALLADARAACSSARSGAVASARDVMTTCTRTIGERTFVVVEPAMVKIYALLDRLAKSDLPVLITGETGTGKENAAAAIHHGSARAKGPFIVINGAALPENLVESELFGYEKGAFSGAVSTKVGLLEAAHGGTVFLDEVGELPLGTQAKLLRILETQRVTRIGAHSERALDVRFVAATNRDLVAEVQQGRFRQDVLFRLGAASVILPPLRDRRRELPVLARTLLQGACDRGKRSPLALAPLTMQKLLSHSWPGNIRELKNAMDYVAATALGPVVEPHELPALAERLSTNAPASGPPRSDIPSPGRGFRPLADEIRELERTRILEALAAAGGVQTRAAELIGMPVRTLFGKLKLYGLGGKGADVTPS